MNRLNDPFKYKWWVCVTVALVLSMAILMERPSPVQGKRGHLPTKYKGRRYFKPITGKYRSEASARYYNNPKVILYKFN